MTYGQITESEAIARGLLAAAVAHRQADGRVVCAHADTRLWWFAGRLPATRAPAWSGGLPRGGA